MEKDRYIYRYAVRELSSLTDYSKLREVTADGGKGIVQVSKVCSLLRSVVEKSSVSVYNGVVYCFTGRIYEPFPHREDFDNMVYELWSLLGLPRPLYDTYTGKILKILRDMILSKEMHPDGSKVVFENGVYDVASKRFSKTVTKDDVCLSSLPYNFDSKAECVNWRMFLDSVLPNREYQMILKEFLGSVFIDRRDVKIETMLLLKGDGANGKSVVFETVTGVLGRDNVSNYGVGELINGQDKKKNIAAINGKRLNYCPEINAFKIARESDTLKALISGEPLPARALYGNNFTAYDIPMLMSNCNKLPYMTDWSNGMRRRFIVLPFDVSIPINKQNPMLSYELAGEYSGIFNWMMEGRDAFLLNGCRFTECDELRKYFRDQTDHSGDVVEDTAIIFMLDRKGEGKVMHAMMPAYAEGCERRGKYVHFTTTYMAYCRWCKWRKRKPVKKQEFKAALVESGYKFRKRSMGLCLLTYMVRDKDLDMNVMKT